MIEEKGSGAYIARAPAMNLIVPHMVKQLAFRFPTLAAATLDNFIVGRNAELVERLRSLSTKRDDERFIYLWGVQGSGRTHLLRGALAALSSAGSHVAYLEGRAEPSLDVIEDHDAVAIDDIEQLSQPAQITVFNLYNRCRDEGKTLLAAGDVPATQLPLRLDLVTRLGWGLVYEVHGLSDTEKAHALTEHARARGFSLQPEVTSYLLTHARRDMPALLTVLDALDQCSLETKRPVSVPLLRELLDREGWKGKADIRSGITGARHGESET